MKHRSIGMATIAVLYGISVAAAAKPAADTQDSKNIKFLRLVRDENEVPTALEAAIVRFAPSDPHRAGPTVDLVSAVHVGEKSYYEELNRRFRDYDVVLYELVAPEGTVIPKGGGGGGHHPVSMLQQGLTRMLDLQFQLQGIDYTAKNFVHADMTPNQFAESMRDRRESLLEMFARMMGYALARQGTDSGGSDAAMLLAFFEKDRSLALKRVMAQQFEDLDGSLAAINGPEGSTLITERNKVALDVLRRQIDKGRKKIAIFYGAGHMPDFQNRLQSQFGLTPVKTEWLVAWNMKK